MLEKTTDLISLLEKSLAAGPQEVLDEIGKVIKVGDGISKVYGLTNAVYSEIIRFEGGNTGIVLDLDEDFVSVVLLDRTIPVIEQEIARRTGEVLQVPVGKALLGRVIDALGNPLDAIGPIETSEKMPIERPAPGIIDRTPVHESLETGTTVIDTLIPIGKGQRELIIGNRNTGKTSLAIDMILHQKGKNVICIYVSIGHKQASTARFVDILLNNQALAYSVIVNADAKESAVNQYLAPYAATTIGEYFMEQGHDVLIIYDDLSNHAIAYRELSLLLRRPPGREAYPGDIFYLHSRLLERACKLSEKHGGGSLTAIPLVQTQGDDLTAYIPTNLISITDGQVVLDTNLFNQGIRPAVNIGLSVSRVGGAAQTDAIKKVAGPLKLELAQYAQLRAFEQFGTELDKASQRVLDRGRRATELLKQEARKTYSFVDQTLFLFLLKERFLDNLPLEDISVFCEKFASYVQEVYPAAYEQIEESESVSEQWDSLKKYAEEFSLSFLKTPSKQT